MAQTYETEQKTTQKIVVEQRAPTQAELAREAEIRSAMWGGEYFILLPVKEEKQAVKQVEQRAPTQAELAREAEIECALWGGENFILLPVKEEKQAAKESTKVAVKQADIFEHDQAPTDEDLASDYAREAEFETAIWAAEDYPIVVAALKHTEED